MALLGVVAAQAIAATPVKTSVTILDGNGERFAGKVTSPKRACVKGRKVILYMRSLERRGGGLYRGFEAVARTRSKSNGAWKVTTSPSDAFLEGDYRAFVAAKRVSSGGHSLLCKSRWGPLKHV
jgi:hypothetical protein